MFTYIEWLLTMVVLAIFEVWALNLAYGLGHLAGVLSCR